MQQRNRVVDAFGDAVQELALAAAPFSVRQNVLGVRVSEDLSLALGVPPGKTAEIATACGMVRIEVESEPRQAELTIAALRGALAAAVAEIDDHNNDYQHRTPKDKLDHWRRLYAGDPAAEASARLAVGDS